jgi:hypothetical protein
MLSVHHVLICVLELGELERLEVSTSDSSLPPGTYLVDDGLHTSDFESRDHSSEVLSVACKDTSNVGGRVQDGLSKIYGY